MNIAFFALCIAAAAAEAQLPPQLRHFEAMKDDETALVDAVRAFDKTELAAATKEAELAAELAMEGKTDEATEKSRDAAQRVRTVRQVYDWLLVQYPRNARVRNNYGELLYDYFGEQLVAVKEWHLAISLDSKLSEPLNNLGIHYCHTGQYQLGFDAYERALELDPAHPDYLFNLTQAYLLHFPRVQEIKGWKKPKIYREAMKLSKKAAQAAPEDFEVVQDYANNFYAAENFDVKPDWKEAAQAWQTARNIARNDNDLYFTWLNEGRVWMRHGNKATAIECFKEAVKLRPDESVARRLLDDLLEEQAQSPQRQSLSGRRAPANSQ